MSHYLDIHLRPDPEFPTHELMAALYGKLHRALAHHQFTTIGVNFPEYSLNPVTIGSVLRLHGSETDLSRLMSDDWLKGMKDHVKILELSVTPESARYCRLYRVQAKSNPERLRRRQIRRHQMSLEEATRKIPDSTAERLRLPFVQFSSASTGQQFRLYIKVDKAVTKKRVGTFNAYGLSATATLPYF